jgi:hypothetical protein
MMVSGSLMGNVDVSYGTHAWLVGAKGATLWLPAWENTRAGYQSLSIERMMAVFNF